MRSIAPLIVLVMLVAAGGWWWYQHGVVPPEPPGNGSEVAASAVDLPQLLELRNRGNAHLEDAEYTEAAAAFDELCRLLPEDPLGFRNRTIGALLAVESLNRSTHPDEYAAGLALVRRHLESLQLLEPDRVETLILSSRIEAAAQNSGASVSDLRAALRIAPDNAALWYELADRTRAESAPEMQQTYLEALRNAHRHAPENLFVLSNYLVSLAKSQDAGMAEALAAARPVIAEVAERVKRRTRYNPLDLLEQAEQALERGEWPRVVGTVTPLGNILRPDDAAQSDRLRIEVHSLEMMAYHLQTLGDAEQQLAAVNDESEPPFAFDVQSSGLEDLQGVLDAALADLDLDGRDEIWLLRSGRIDVYGRAVDGPQWEQLTSTAIPEGLSRFTVADLDQDVIETVTPASVPAGQLPDVSHAADIDVVLCGENGVLLLRNDDLPDGRRLVPVEAESWPDLEEVVSTVAADINSDGDLDLILLTSGGLKCWSNLGGFEFAELPVPRDIPANPTAVTPVDVDRDVDLDLVLGLADGQVGYLENLRHGTFRWRGIGATSGTPGPVTAVDVVDSDGNASWDVLAATSGGITRLPSRWIEPGEVKFDAPQLASDFPGPGLLSGDFNNSGRIDLLGWAGNSLRIAAGANGGTWSPSAEISTAIAMTETLHCRPGDLDQDGDLDLLIVSANGATVLTNSCAAPGAWLEIGLVAQQVKGMQSAVSGRVNHYGLGSLLEVRTGAQYQSRVVRGGSTHFGLGSGRTPDAVRIIWTNGIPENLIEPAIRQYVCERQTLKGSCPYLYTWNGDGYEFVTDLLWAAPIGLIGANGELVPCREWEYLLIPGEKLQPIDAEYRLSITEELWEAAYFDQVELVAVDHPADVSLYTNEKVGPPDLASPKLHAVIERRHPVLVQDQSGRDLLPLVVAADERYAVPFQSKLRQGYTEETTLELDLGLTERPEQLTLFLTGWVYPTDTSINAGLAEDDRLPGPRPPSISTPNAGGGWDEVIPFCGFPGGKTKTIAIEMRGDQFSTADYRVRISTSMELAWDEIFFTVNQAPSEYREQPLRLLEADLHVRGYSAVIEHPDAGPERYGYQRVTTAPRWPSMSGRFTRYGAVTELIARADDRSVVFGSGDELIVRFAVPVDPPPAGWKRDFVLHNVGWDKDADLHTIYGQTVEPLPMRGMTGYPDAAAESRFAEPEMQEYLREYQTREVDSRRFVRELVRGRR